MRPSILARNAVVVVTVALAAFGLVACSDDEERPAVTGTVLAPPEAPPLDQLPANATLTVALEDVSRADAAAILLASEEFSLADESFPVAFELPYDLGSIDDASTYRVAARVAAGGDLLMISDTIVPVITGGAPTSGVEVPLVYLPDN